MIDYVVAMWNLLGIAYSHNSKTQFLLHAYYMYIKIIEVTTDKIFHDRRDGVIIMFCNKIRVVKTLSN
jgi:nitrous oxidase accessory protein NosD